MGKLAVANRFFKEGNFYSAIKGYNLVKRGCPELESHANFNIFLANKKIVRAQGERGGIVGFNISSQDKIKIEEITNDCLLSSPKRFYEKFDLSREDEFFKLVERVFSDNEERVLSKTATIVMPTYNRASIIIKAIQSVQAQTHENWQLIIVDDGSTDNTFELIQSQFDDPRIKVVQGKHEGVSAARNLGLEHAQGEYVFYLDSDNKWTPNFLRGMIVFMEVSGAPVAYSGVMVESAEGKVEGYRGEAFSWEECLKSNYVDMNVFGHKRSVLDYIGNFDTDLRRMVDWDLVLRITKYYGAVYVPFIGCVYSDYKSIPNRVSIKEPYCYRFIVQNKNRYSLKNAKEVGKHLSLRFCIKIPAPYDKREAWGDFHYAESLAGALVKKGHKCRIDFLGKWYDRNVTDDDVVIVIRGLTQYEPQAGQINIMWNISHPDQVGYEEYEAYDWVYIASLSYPNFLNNIIRTPAFPLLQCSDKERFFPSDNGKKNDAILFVGNSRNEYRDIVRWGVESNIDIQVVGQRWEQFLPKSMIAGENIKNSELGKYYSSAKAVLNDHWQSMKEFGFISNRLFDIASCAGRVISDSIPSIDRVFDGFVEQVSGKDELKDSLNRNNTISKEQREEFANFIHEYHSFDARANKFIRDVYKHLGICDSTEIIRECFPSVKSSRKKIKIGLILQRGKIWPTSSGFIRLIAPLTSEQAFQHIDCTVLSGVYDSRLTECDCCIVQRVGVSRDSDARHLVDICKSKNINLIVDNDDALGLAVEYKERNDALCSLMSQADDVWFSTSHLMEQYSEFVSRGEVISNSLDPRIWKNYREKGFSHGAVVEMLYMGTATHDEDFKLILPALDQLNEAYPGKFRLTIVGAVRNPPKREWLYNLPVPASEGAYPRFVKWLKQHRKFRVGLAPLQVSKFNECKSDIKFLDYTALGLLSIVSDSNAYRSAISSGYVISAGCDANSWAKALKRIVEDIDSFEGVRQQAWNYLWDERSVNTSAVAMINRIKNIL